MPAHDYFAEVLEQTRRTLQRSREVLDVSRAALRLSPTRERLQAYQQRQTLRPAPKPRRMRFPHA